jgi:hypothetical protein
MEGWTENEGEHEREPMENIMIALPPPFYYPPLGWLVSVNGII